MDTAELDIAIEELETRVERLRALYDQYFMGIEKMPPQVVHKDVDRRLHALRKEQIRNTGKRFKLQTIIQRYNTFQQYWMRIMREIENGTYRRHVLRAERSVGVVDAMSAAERRRLGLDERPADAPSTAEGNESPRSAAEIRAEIERDLGLFLDEEPPSTARLSNRARLIRRPSTGPESRSSLAPKSERRRSLRPPQTAGVPEVGMTRPAGAKLPIASAVGGRGLPPPVRAELPKVPPKIDPTKRATGSFPVATGLRPAGAPPPVPPQPPVRPMPPSLRRAEDLSGSTAPARPPPLPSPRARESVSQSVLEQQGRSPSAPLPVSPPAILPGAVPPKIPLGRGPTPALPLSPNPVGAGDPVRTSPRKPDSPERPVPPPLRRPK